MISYPVVVVVAADDVAFLFLFLMMLVLFLFVLLFLMMLMFLLLLLLLLLLTLLLFFFGCCSCQEAVNSNAYFLIFLAVSVVDVVVRDGDQGLISSFNVVVVVPEDEGDGVQLWGYWEWHIAMFSYLDRRHLFLSRHCPRCCFCCCDEHEAKGSVKVELLRFDVLEQI